MWHSWTLLVPISISIWGLCSRSRFLSASPLEMLPFYLLLIALKLLFTMMHSYINSSWLSYMKLQLNHNRGHNSYHGRNGMLFAWAFFVFFEQGANLLALVHGRWPELCCYHLNCQMCVNSVCSYLVFLSNFHVSWGITRITYVPLNGFILGVQGCWAGLSELLWHEYQCPVILKSGKNGIYCSKAREELAWVLHQIVTYLKKYSA